MRSLGPVWSRPNAFGHGVPFKFPSSPDTGPGLTDAGKALVQACNQLGVLIDLSHLNEQGFWDVARISSAPLEVLIRHVDHLVEHVGPEGVGFGSDFDGTIVRSAIGDAAGLPRLVEALRAHGYDDASLRRLCFANWLRVLGRTWRPEQPAERRPEAVLGEAAAG